MAGQERVSVVGLGALKVRPRRVVLVGNPNVGKSSLFNALTGLHQKTSNYPGTTVERRAGTFSVQGSSIDVIDLPGTYSLLPRSPDETVVRDELLGRLSGGARPDVAVVVLDATNLERNLFLATQVFETGIPAVVAVNQCDLALARGVRIDPARLSAALGVPVVATCGRTGQGRDDLAAAIASGGARARDIVPLTDERVLAAAAALAPTLKLAPGSPYAAPGAVARALVSEGDAGLLTADLNAAGDAAGVQSLCRARAALEAQKVDVVAGLAAARYDAIERLLAGIAPPAAEAPAWQRRLDAVLTHPLAGTLALALVAAAVFYVIFSGVEPLMGAVESVFSWISDDLVKPNVAEGLFRSFLTDGVIAGFAGFLVFVPQIAVIFILLEMLDDSGYLSRAAFLLDRVMGQFGLPGRAFLPLLSGFACAIPGIMSARTISNTRDRMVTMAVLPLMSCSARLPVYFLLIGVVFAGAARWVPGVVLVSMYLVGIVVALLFAGVLRRTVLKGGRTPLLLELPPYRLPSLRTVARNVGRRTWSFVAGAGPIILVLTVVLWGLATFPRDVPAAAAFEAEAAALEAKGDTDGAAAATASAKAARNEASYLGRAGRAIEPVIAPLGFDWKCGVGVLASFAAREVFVPTLGVIHAVGDEQDEESEPLRASMAAARWPEGGPHAGRLVYTPLSAISIMVFYVLALQCMSTLAVLKRETGGWRWPIGLFIAFTALAYLASFAVFQTGLALGF